MPRSLKDAIQQATPQETNFIASKIAGEPEPKKAKRGSAIASQPRPVDIMIFGPWGSGKSYLIITLLEANLKVLVLNTDFGGKGLDTVYNYFKKNAEKSHLLYNLVEIRMDAKDFIKFCRDPKSIQIEDELGDIDIYQFDPDVLFWDGGTSYQQVYLEQDIVGEENLLREKQEGEDTWAMWRAAKNGTTLPMLKFLEMTGTSGKPWSKVVTFLDDKKFEKEDTGETDKKKGTPIKRNVPGSDKTGPMLHTDARKLSGAGFSICMEASSEDFGNTTKYYLTVEHADKMVKNRGFDLPKKIDVTQGQPNFWTKYIEPMIGGTK